MCSRTAASFRADTKKMLITGPLNLQYLKTPLATEWEYATILNDQTTRIYVAWLVRTLNELLPRLRTFVEAA